VVNNVELNNKIGHVRITQHFEVFCNNCCSGKATVHVLLS